MVKYSSRVKSGLKPLQKESKKEMASKVLERSPEANKTKIAEAINASKKPIITNNIKDNIRTKVVQAVKKKAIQKKKGGALPTSKRISDETINQMTHVPFIHMLGGMDMPTHHILQGIASNYLKAEHPMRLITKHALGGNFEFPKHLSKIAMRDVMKAQSPQQLSHALHSEWMDKLQGKLSQAELGGGLFASLKTLVKKGIAGGKKGLSALAKGAAQAVRAVSAGAKGAQHIGKSVSSALDKGLEVANSLSPIIQQVFPESEGILRTGLGHANAAKELLDRGIDISSQVEKAIAPAIDVLGPLDDPIAFPFEQEQQVEKGGAMQEYPEERINEESGPRFVS